MKENGIPLHDLVCPLFVASLHCFHSLGQHCCPTPRKFGERYFLFADLYMIQGKRKQKTLKCIL
jgi:hypothetical protein